MGPYCDYCGHRCFVPITEYWPKHIQEAYGRYTIAATCARGQAYEKATIGYCYADAKPALESCRSC